MHKSKSQTRLDKFEKRRKNTRRITILSILATIVALFLIVSIIFRPNKETVKNEQPQIEQNAPGTENRETDDQESTLDSEKNSDRDTEGSDTEESDREENSEDDIVTENIDSADDNVAHAFTANWKPVGTAQTGNHTINLSEGTTDRNELEEAIRLATSLEDMTVWWLEREGDGRVKATVSNKNDQSEIYRVFNEWVDEEGWRPIKVEVLKENDQKWRFE